MNRSSDNDERKVCPFCGGWDTAKLKRFVSDESDDDLWLCYDCDEVFNRRNRRDIFP